MKTHIDSKEFICHKCKTPLNCVCLRSIISVCEDGYEFECFSCFIKDRDKEFEKQKYAKETLAKVLSDVLKYGR